MTHTTKSLVASIARRTAVYFDLNTALRPLMTAVALMVLSAFPATALAATHPQLDAKLSAEGFDTEKLHAKVHPELLAELESDAERPFLKARGGPRRYHVDVRLSSGEGLEEKRAAFGSKAAQAQRQDKVATAQQRVFHEMLDDLNGLEAFELRYQYKNFYGFTALADDRAIAALAQLDGAVRIFEVPDLEPTDNQAHALTGVEDVRWEVNGTINGFAGQGVTIALIDGGLDYTHAAFGDPVAPPSCASNDSCEAPYPLTSKVIAGVDLIDDDFDPMPSCEKESHGTKTASVAAGNGGGVVGVAPNAQLVHVRIKSSKKCFDYRSEGMSAGIDWVLDHHVTYGIDVVTMSLSKSIFHSDYCDDDLPYISDLEDLRNAGIPFFTGSGNDGWKNGLTEPACSSKVLSVGAVYDTTVGLMRHSTTGGGQCTGVAITDHVPCYSNSAETLDLLGPSTCATAAKVGGGIDTCASGTSMASPYVAGVAALLLQKNPNLTVDEISDLLINYGTPVTDIWNGLEKPRVDALASIIATPQP